MGSPQSQPQQNQNVYHAMPNNISQRYSGNGSGYGSMSNAQAQSQNQEFMNKLAQPTGAPVDVYNDQLNGVNSKLLGNNNHILLILRMSGCGHCENYRPAIEAAKTELFGYDKRLIQDYLYTDPQVQGLAQSLSANGFPATFIVTKNKNNGSATYQPVELVNGRNTASLLKTARFLKSI